MPHRKNPLFFLMPGQLLTQNTIINSVYIPVPPYRAAPEPAVYEKPADISGMSCLSPFPITGLAYHYGPTLVFALNTGLREGELLALSKNGIITGEDGRKKIHISETLSLVKNRDEKAETKSVWMIHLRNTPAVTG